MDIGLRVEYDGKKNVVLAGKKIKECPIGGLMCEYARLRPTELKEVILSNPFWNEESLSEKGGDALYAFYNDMVEKFDVVFTLKYFLKLTGISIIISLLLFLYFDRNALIFLYKYNLL